MEATIPSLTEVLLVLIAALVSLIVVIWRGWLAPGALAQAPRRETGLGLLDVAGGLICMVAGVAASTSLLSRLGLVDAQMQPMQHDGDPAPTMVIVALVSQALSQGLIVGYVLVRAGSALVPGHGSSSPDSSSTPGFNGLRELGVWPRRWRRELAGAVIGFFVAVAVVFAINLGGFGVAKLLGHEPPAIAHDLLDMMRQTRSSMALAGLMFSAIVVAPIVEEVVFRGLLQTVIAGVMGWRHRAAAVVITSLLFTSIHVQAVWLFALPGLFVLSLILGWLYERHGSLWPSILVHAGFNAFNVIFAVWLLDAPSGP